MLNDATKAENCGTSELVAHLIEAKNKADSKESILFDQDRMLIQVVN